jgi:hypothetical protein
MSPVALRPFLTEGLPFSSAVTGEERKLTAPGSHYKDFDCATPDQCQEASDNEEIEVLHISLM